MASGFIYNIEEKIENLGISESDFYENIGELNVDYVEQVDQLKAKQLMSDFAKRLEIMGFTVTPHSYEDWDTAHHDIYKLETGSAEQVKAIQKAYFGHRLERLEAATKALDAERFCSDVGYAMDLRDLICDASGDVVSSRTDTIVEMDRFIRYLQPDKVYYLGDDVVLMH